MLCGCDLPLIEQLIGTSIANAVSPGYMFDRTGTNGVNNWLKAGNIFSNVTGWPFGLANGKINGIWVGNEDLNTFDIDIYEHEGDEVNLTNLVTVSVGVAARNAFFDASDFGVVNITQGYQLAARVSGGSIKEPRVVVFAGGTL